MRKGRLSFRMILIACFLISLLSIGSLLSLHGKSSSVLFPLKDVTTTTMHNEKPSSIVSSIVSSNSNMMNTTTTTGTHDTTTTTTTHDTKKRFVAVVVCTRSTKSWQSVEAATLHTHLLPSIEKTIQQDEWKTFRVEVIVAFDDGDTFWETNVHRKNLVAALHTQQQHHISVNFVSIPKKNNRTHRIPFNEACRAAYDYGADYIVRVNDDSEFMTNGWITKGVSTLANYDYPPNIGVVGPTCKEGNTRILTHDMVHRTHLDIFADYYPDEFDNWWIDDWITAVYGTNRTTKRSDWVVKHHLDKYGSRYATNAKQRLMLRVTLERGKKRIQQYLDTGAKDTNIGAPGLYTVVAGPMMRFATSRAAAAASSSSPTNNNNNNDTGLLPLSNSSNNSTQH